MSTTYELKETLLTLSDVCLRLGVRPILSEVHAVVRNVTRPGRLQGQVVAVSTDEPILFGMAAQDPNVKIVGDKLTDEPYGIGIPKNNTDMVRYVNAVLEKIREDMGLNRPLTEQYLDYMANALRGDLGLPSRLRPLPAGWPRDGPGPLRPPGTLGRVRLSRFAVARRRAWSRGWPTARDRNARPSNASARRWPGRRSRR